MKVIFVCLGNICRSPTAEAIFRKKAIEKFGEDRFEIDSAGTAAYHVGELADPRSRAKASERGYEITSQARKFYPFQDFEKFDLILVMDQQNYRDIVNMAEGDRRALAKVKMMTDFMPSKKWDHIPDPYHEGEQGFDLVVDILEECCDGLLESLDIDS